MQNRRKSRRRALAAVAVAMAAALVGCSSSGSASTSAPTAPSVSGTIVAAAASNCLDEPGTASGTLQQWYPEMFNGFTGFDASLQPTVSERGVTLESAIVQAVSDQLDGFESAGLGELVDFDGTCITVRRVSFERADGASVSVAAWRAGEPGQPFGIPMLGPISTIDDQTVAVESESFTTALAVADDGTTVRVIAYGPFQRQRMEGWPTTIPAPTNAPAPGPTPATADQAAAIAASVLAAAVDR